MITIQRIYEPVGSGTVRLLVDRLWPRGLSKTAAMLDGWYKEVAPTTELRRWFGHDAARFAEFGRRYLEELDHRSSVVAELLALAHRGDIVLLSAAHDPIHNHAVVLAQYLQGHMSD